MQHDFNTENLDFIENLYQDFKQHPTSVPENWEQVFAGMEFDKRLHSPDELNFKVYKLIQAYRQFGYLHAQLNPLNDIASPILNKTSDLSPENFGLNKIDLQNSVKTNEFIGDSSSSTFELLQFLNSRYCGTLSVQLSPQLSQGTRSWFHQQVESPVQQQFSREEKLMTLNSIIKAEAFEKFIHQRFVGAKRFSVEGADALMPMLEKLTTLALEDQISELFMGMAHRGRLNVLAHVFDKPIEEFFSEFNGQDLTAESGSHFEGDVKYHQGRRTEKRNGGKKCELTLAFNPSHLEAVNPVVLGMTYACQNAKKLESAKKTVLPILVHGDAAFAGQGIVLETLQLSALAEFSVGGTIHLVIDNQIGFTANSERTRSTKFSSDIAKVIDAPVLHCNGDDVEACLRAMQMAFQYRQKFQKDVIINLLCYRRFGHNEGDEPAYTQPAMYEKIRNHPTLLEIYGRQLAQESVISPAEVQGIFEQNFEQLQKIFDGVRAKANLPDQTKIATSFVKPLGSLTEQQSFTESTKVNFEKLKHYAHILAQVPESFHLHPKLKKLFEQREAVAHGDSVVDWGLAELLAYSSLLAEAVSVRLSGQDCVRGTFSHRHAGVFDCKTEIPYFAAKQFETKNSKLCVVDSCLSEYGVMGFEYGQSIMPFPQLTIWEAQFGDFSNGAQIIIDQFIASGETKWQQQSDLVLLLPHGYEGQGPEHSSARLERFLQLCAQNNIQVANLTTPAQIFHLLRRQAKLTPRKPLVIMTPKSLLRHPLATSHLVEFSEGQFQEVIPDQNVYDPREIETLLLCSGKIYYELAEQRKQTLHNQSAIVRLEMLYPTPKIQLSRIIRSYPRLKNIAWVQEEPRNMGAYSHLYFKLSELISQENRGNLKFHYIGRGEKASPAAGSLVRHKAEQLEIIRNAFMI